jgi:uncharacterized protein (TIGR02217 family)
MSTITPDLAETFPNCPTYGFVSEPNYLVKITAREGGFERRQLVWARPLLKFTGVPFGDQPQEDIEDILDFWHAMRAMAFGFRFRDWIDYKSCRLAATPAATDQPLIASTDSPSKFQLVKQYITKSGRTIQEREITRPVGSAYIDELHSYAGIQVANETGTIQTDWTLDEATGIVTPGGSFAGTPHSWGGEFHVWSRFDAVFNPSISEHQVMNATVQLAQIREPLA